MRLEVNISNNLQKLIASQIDINIPLEKSLLQIGAMIQNSARENAPYKSGTLRKSIGLDLSQIKQRIVVVGSPVVYSRIQEFGGIIRPRSKPYLTFKIGGQWIRARQVTIKGKFYMKRAIDQNKNSINTIIDKNLKTYFG